MRKTSFTLVEMLFVILIISILMPIIFSSYNRIQQAKFELDLRQKLYQQSYEILERMNILLQDYTIDYEEYFNRQMVGCSWSKRGASFQRDVGSTGHCTAFTAYGNQNWWGWDAVMKQQHLLYYLSSLNSKMSYSYNDPYVVKCENCPDFSKFKEGMQSFWQYSKLFYDVKNDTDLMNWLVGDTDDENLGVGPKAIVNATTGIQELYLISQDGKSRLFFRRNLVMTGDFDDDNLANSTGEKLYVIQILRLRGFDAGTKHNFSITEGSSNPGLYDGQIDTWACDYSQGFFGHWSGVNGAYSGYNLPNSVDDCRVDWYVGDMTVDGRNLTIYPDTSPQLAWKNAEVQINPYVKVFMFNRIYLPRWKTKLKKYFQDFHVAVETIFNTRSSYSQ